MQSEKVDFLLSNAFNPLFVMRDLESFINYDEREATEMNDVLNFITQSNDQLHNEFL